MKERTLKQIADEDDILAMAQYLLNVSPHFRRNVNGGLPEYIEFFSYKIRKAFYGITGLKDPNQKPEGEYE